MEKIKPGDEIYVRDRWGINLLIAEKVTAKQIKVVSNRHCISRVYKTDSVKRTAATDAMVDKIDQARKKQREYEKEKQELRLKLFGY